MSGHAQNKSKKAYRLHWNNNHKEGRKVYSLRKRLGKMIKKGNIKQAEIIEGKIEKLSR